MFVVCDFRRGSPRIDVRVCKVCKEEKCKDRKRIQAERVPKCDEGAVNKDPSTEVE